MNLSAEQQKIINATNQHICVTASAGSGKTTILAERICHLINNRKRGEKVLAITFNNKAANEINDRLLQKYPQHELNDLVRVGTIHSFCMKLVLQRAHSISLPSELHIFESFDDRLEICKKALSKIPSCWAFHMNEDKLDDKKVYETFSKISEFKRNFALPPENTNPPLFSQLYHDYNDLLLSQNSIDFDDVLIYAYKILTEKPVIADIYQRIYKYICVDEAQDLNKAQYHVIKALANENTHIFMVGDPKQAIYTFNGSNPKYMTDNFIADFHEVAEYSLNENYRSARQILQAAAAIEPTFNAEIKSSTDGEVFIMDFPTEEKEAEWVYDKINELLKTHKPSQIAIIARNKYVFNALEGVFKKQGKERGKYYDFRISTQQNTVSESLFFKVFDLGLKLLINPKNILHFGEMQNLLQLENTTEEPFEDWRNGEFFQSAMDKNEVETLNRAWDAIKDREDKNQPFDFAKPLEILEEYCEQAKQNNVDEMLILLNNDFQNWQKHWDSYKKNIPIDQKNLASLLKEISTGGTKSSNEQLITLSTVHTAKGLEFDVVFIIGLNEGIFPDYKAKTEFQLLEERQNMFVAITRTKRICYLSYPRKRKTLRGMTVDKKPSQYIAKIQNKMLNF
ncbi:MAG: ATP-dependent helicase [Defluviitaleaceae bacterium]|nr:ATP-dependent helicase [Defluviitaleaceae bacterium]